MADVEDDFLGGSALREAALIRQWADEIKTIQARLKKRARGIHVARPFHAKSNAGIESALFKVAADLPQRFHVALFQPGREFRAIVRFSNASGLVQPDAKKDMRGVAIRVLDGEKAHDFLMTSAPASHARNAAQFMVAARASARSRIGSFFTLLLGLGPLETIRMVRALRAGQKKHTSMALMQYWSRAPIAFGPNQYVKYTLRPAPDTPKNDAAINDRDENYLRTDLARRLKSGPVHFEFCIQEYIPKDAHGHTPTPINDGTVAWTTPEIPIAEIILPRIDLASNEAREAESRVNATPFNVWRTVDELRPVGSLNRARKLVYSASSAHWSGRAEPPPRVRLCSRILESSSRIIFSAVNRLSAWHKLPWTWLQLANLYALRNDLRRHNLHDTSTPVPTATPSAEALPPELFIQRSDSGIGNDLAEPAMGEAGARFGRNMPIEELKKVTGAQTGGLPRRLFEPNPRSISYRLMKRKEFIPASSLNLLAAAWIQFQTHDWFNHGRIKQPTAGDFIDIPRPAEGDDWPADERMLVPRTPVDASRNRRDAALDPLPTFRNAGSHWWDGSQIYGSDLATSRKLRRGVRGRLRTGDEPGLETLEHVETDVLLPLDENGLELSGFTDNWWIGLSLLHTLFAREHNAICERLVRHHPDWKDERLFQTARLINTALLAKIHTVEWTPAILGTPALKTGMRANWWGLTGERFKRAIGRLGDSEGLSGIVTSPLEHGAAPFSLTEEFVSVYRMHPLMPDHIPLRSIHQDGIQRWINTEDYLAADVRKLNDVPMIDVAYSFGCTNPGAITLGNFPNFMRRLTTHGRKIDLATVDVLRDRERCVPRYNDFRRMLRMPRVASFEKLNPRWASELSDIYGSDGIDNLDALVGMQAETPPQGFGFSDTAFRIFILMASRRLKSDRFFTTDYSREMYTQVGLDWIDDNDMRSVILRHYPELGPSLHGLDNAFVPWHSIALPVPQP